MSKCNLCCAFCSHIYLLVFCFIVKQHNFVIFLEELIFLLLFWILTTAYHLFKHIFSARSLKMLYKSLKIDNIRSGAPLLAYSYMENVWKTAIKMAIIRCLWRTCIIIPKHIHIFAMHKEHILWWKLMWFIRLHLWYLMFHGGKMC